MAKKISLKKTKKESDDKTAQAPVLRWTLLRVALKKEGAWQVGQTQAFRWALLGAALSLGAPAGLWALLSVVPESSPNRWAWAYAYCALGTAAAFATFGAVAGRLMDKLELSASTDPLTGLANRLCLNEQLPRLRALCERRGESLGVFFLDLDRFKRVNDAHGHAVGDRALRAVAEALQKQTRQIDLLARYGGEEFVLVALDMERERGARLAERLRAAAESLSAEALGFPGPQTVSIGWALSPANGERFDLGELLKKADSALYAAKASGRNRAVEAGHSVYNERPASATLEAPLA